MKKIRVDFRETHERSAEILLTPAELREIVLEGLKRRGVNVAGSVTINYYGHECHSTSSELSAGPAIQVWIKQRLPV